MQDWERLYLLTKARWLLKEGPLVERAVCEEGVQVVEDAPSFTQRRLKKKAVRVSIFGFQRRDGEPAACLSCWCLVGAWVMMNENQGCVSLLCVSSLSHPPPVQFPFSKIHKRKKTEALVLPTVFKGSGYTRAIETEPGAPSPAMQKMVRPSSATPITRLTCVCLSQF